MKALIIRSPWIDLILSGQKTWEMRKQATHVRGPIALIQAGSGLVVGTAELADSLPPLTPAQMRAHQAQHGIPATQLDEVQALGWVTPWVLRNVRRLPDPVPYAHPKGAVIWVELPADALGQTAKAVVKPAVAQPAAASPIVSGQWADITVTQGNLNNNHLYLREAWSLLPTDCIGGSNKLSLGREVTLHLEGGATLSTDVDGSKKLFRCRGPIGEFFARHGVQAGDTVRLTRVSERVFHVAKRA